MDPFDEENWWDTLVELNKDAARKVETKLDSKRALDSAVLLDLATLAIKQYQSGDLGEARKTFQLYLEKKTPILREEEKLRRAEEGRARAHETRKDTLNARDELILDRARILKRGDAFLTRSEIAESIRETWDDYIQTDDTDFKVLSIKRIKDILRKNLG